MSLSKKLCGYNASTVTVQLTAVGPGLNR